MSDAFNADWLALRERSDHAARAAGLLASLRTRTAAAHPLRVLDLGAGTGSNLRYLAPRLTVAQHGTLLDHDAHLLARAGRVVGTVPDATGKPVIVITQQADLGTLDADLLRRADLVTGSALLDLVTADWLDNLVRHCAALALPALFALTYDGTTAWSPADPDDPLARDLINDHQTRDKGLGPALGPTACGYAIEAFTAAGFRVQAEPSPWQLGPGASALQRELLDGWATAATAQSADAADRLRHWAERRRHHIAEGTSRVTVGHLDLLAEPPS